LIFLILHIHFLGIIMALNQVYVLLGSNIEPRENYLSSAKNELQNRIGHIVEESSIYETEAWGFDSETSFLNVVLKIETDFDADDFLRVSKEIEVLLGRNRGLENRYSSRTMDIDILYYNTELIETDDLIVPHPRLQLRRFTMEPLVEIAPDLIHPVYNKTNKELLRFCKDDAKVWKFGN
jgi:2-amino-4-hydroxy-6-hydroxymethyldihydropteridine diphosphokinase